MPYQDIGYDEFLSKSGPADNGFQTNAFQGISADQFANPTSASSIQTGVIQSQDGKLSMDLSSNTFRISDGAQDRITLGTLPDGSVGLLLKDANGNILMQISGVTNIIQSANGNISLDFTNQQLIIKDEGGTPRVLLGKF